MDSEKSIPDKRHPNSPLAEVVFELRFPGETAIESKRHEIQNRIRSDYPQLLVPPARNGIYLALEPYRFEREDNSAGIMVALNRFSYFSRAYPGFDAFKKECLHLVSLFTEVIELERLNRIGLRHINVIPFVKENQYLPLKYYFRFTDYLEKFFDTEFEHFTTQLAFPFTTGNMTLNLEVIKNTNSNQEAFMFDLDYGRVEGVEVNRIEEYLEEAHRESAILFKNIIKTEYYEYIRGMEI